MKGSWSSFKDTFSESESGYVLKQDVSSADFTFGIYGGSIFKKIKAYSNILVPLFISAFKKADFLAESMESRCYDINSKRTRFKNPSLTKSDVLFAGLMILMSIGVIVCDLIINF